MVPLHHRYRIPGLVDSRLPAYSGVGHEISSTPLILLDAQSLTGFVNGDPVATFTDVSGSGYHGTASGTNRPTYTTNAIGSTRPAVVFNGTGHVLTLPYISAGSTSFTIVVVGMRSGSRTAYSGPIANNQASSDGWQVVGNNGNTTTDTLQIRKFSTSAENGQYNSGPDWPTSASVIIMPSTGSWRYAGVAQGSSSSVSGYARNSSNLGGAGDDASSDRFGMTIGEYRLYAGVLSGGDIATLETALATRWGI